MKKFTYTKGKAVIRTLKEPKIKKKKLNFDRIIYFLILIGLFFWLVSFAYKKTKWIYGNGQMLMEKVDVNFTNDLAAVQRKLYQKIQQAKEKLSLEELNQSTAAALIAMIALEQMVAEYMSYNINVFGGHAVTDSRMADNAVVFRDSVAQITGHDANRKAIQAKWHFIEKTLLNYNQQSATFIVMKTTDKIRALLPV